MKKIVLFICLAFITITAVAQNPAGERIKAFKAAYITEQLNLSSKEAQQFWPIYNTHEETVERLKKEEKRLIRALKDANEGPDGLSDRKAGEFLNKYLEAETQKTQARKKLLKDLQTVISNKKILRLIKAENDFNKKLLERVRQWRNRRNN